MSSTEVPPTDLSPSYEEEAKDSFLVDMKSPTQMKPEPFGSMAKSSIVSTLNTPTPRNVRSFAWRDVTFYYPQKAGLTAQIHNRFSGKEVMEAAKGAAAQKPALDKITGYVDAGTMIAVIGASGAGKSTLLDILARRFNKGRLEGQMLVNGKPISDDDFKEISGYVPQEDNFVVTQTAYEALLFIANLTMGPGVSKADKDRIIQELAGDAGLAHRLNVRIGGIIQGGLRLKGMSGGEKRRLALVACAITNPSIMFLDEPTSGLDSYAALKIIQKAADWASRGRIVLCTIHQPRSQIWDLFDDVLILGAEGRQVYFGSVDDVPSWFNGLGYPVPANTSVSDYVLDLLNNSFSPQHRADKMEKSMRRLISKGKLSDSSIVSQRLLKLRREQSIHINVTECTQTFKQSTQYAEILRDIDEAVAEGKKEVGQPLSLGTQRGGKVSWLTTFFTLIKRNGLNYARNPGNVAARLIMTTFVALLAGWAYEDLTGGVDKLDPLSLSKYTGYILVSLTLVTIVLTLLPFVSISLFIYDRTFFHKESRAKLYSPSAYFLANVVLEMLLNGLIGAIFGMIQYFMQGLGHENGSSAFNPTQFLTYVALVMAMANVGCMQSIMFSLIAPNQDIAFVLSCGYTTVAMLTQGQMVPPEMLNRNLILSLLQYISSMRYGWRALVNNEFSGVVFNNIKNLNLLVPGAPEKVTAEWVLCAPIYGFRLCDMSMVTDVSMIAVVFTVMTLVSFLALKHLNQD